MTAEGEGSKELFSHLNLVKTGPGKPIADTILMAVDLMKYQAEVALEVSKRQAISITTTTSSIAIGWSTLFLGLSQQSWFASSIGLMMVFAGVFLLAVWTPKMLNRARDDLDKLGAKKLYDKWLAGTATAEGAGKSQ